MIPLKKFLPLQCWDGLGQGVGWMGWEGLVWGVAFVETRLAGSLGGGGRAGWGGLGLGFHFGHWDCPFPTPPQSMEPLSSLILCTPPLLQLCFQSPTMESLGEQRILCGGAARVEERSPPLCLLSVARFLGSACSWSFILLLVSLLPPVFPSVSSCLVSSPCCCG